MFFSFLFGVGMIGLIASRVLSRKWMAEWKANNGVLGVILAWSMFVFVVAVIAGFVVVFMDDGGCYIPGVVLDAVLIVVCVSGGVSVLTMFVMAGVGEARLRREKRNAERDYGRD